MKITILLFSLLLAAPAFAAPAKKNAVPTKIQRLWFSPFIYNTQMEKNDQQEFPWIQTRTYAASYTRNELEFLLEYNHDKLSSGNATSSIATETTAWNLWLRLFNYKGPVATPWSLYLGLAAGVYQESVITTFMSEERIDTTGSKPQLGVKAGVQYRAKLTDSNWELQVRAEARAFYSGNFNPDPRPSLQGSLGMAYNF